LRYAISTILWAARRLDRQALRTFKASGFDSIELFMQRPHFDPRSKREISALRSDLKAEGLAVISAHMPIYRYRLPVKADRKALLLSLSSPDPILRSETVAELEAAIRAAGRLGAENLVVHTGIKDNDDAGIARCADSLRGPAGLAGDLGVSLAVENGTDPGATVAALHRLIDLLGSPNVGICIDIGHANLFSAPAADLAAAGDRLLSLHVHDNDGASDQHLVPGGGSVEFPAVRSVLKTSRFSGICTFEVGPAPGDDPEDPARLARTAGTAGGAMRIFRQEMAD
jgi:sugar phosphate isomerase/epimerase